MANSLLQAVNILEKQAHEPSVFGCIASRLLHLARTPGALCLYLKYASSADELRTALECLAPVLDALRKGTAAEGSSRLLCPSCRSAARDAGSRPPLLPARPPGRQPGGTLACVRRGAPDPGQGPRQRGRAAARRARHQRPAACRPLAAARWSLPLLLPARVQRRRVDLLLLLLLLRRGLAVAAAAAAAGAGAAAAAAPCARELGGEPYLGEASPERNADAVASAAATYLEEAAPG